jgi:hypothetical protein
MAMTGMGAANTPLDEGNVLWDEPVTLLGERITLMGEPFALLGEPFALLGERISLMGEPFVLLGEPFALLGERIAPLEDHHCAARTASRASRRRDRSAGLQRATARNRRIALPPAPSRASKVPPRSPRRGGRSPPH